MLDNYLSEVFSDPTAMALALAGEAAEPSRQAAALRRQAADPKKVNNLVGVLSSGVVSEAITETLAAKESEHKWVRQRLAELEADSVHVDVAQIEEDLRELGGALPALHLASSAEHCPLESRLSLRMSCRDPGATSTSIAIGDYVVGTPVT